MKPQWPSVRLQGQHSFNARLSAPLGPRAKRSFLLQSQPLVKEADPELEKLLDEEEAIAQRTAAGETNQGPRMRGSD